MANTNLNSAKGLLSVGKDAVVNTYIAQEALTAGDWVDLDNSQTGEARMGSVVQGNATGMCIGVALETITVVGSLVRVCVEGYVEGALTDGGVASGEVLMPGAAGIADTYAAATVLMPIGVALEADGVSPNDATHVDCVVFRNIA